MASNADGLQLGQPLLERRQGALAQRAPGLAEHVFGPLQIQVGRPPRQREQAAAGRTHARAQPGPQAFAGLGGQRRPHHPPGLVGLAVDQAPARGRIRQLPDVHAAAGRLPAQDLDGGVDRRHDPPPGARIAVLDRGTGAPPASPASGAPSRGAGLGRAGGATGAPARRALAERRRAHRRRGGAAGAGAGDRAGPSSKVPPARPGPPALMPARLVLAGLDDLVVAQPAGARPTARRRRDVRRRPRALRRSRRGRASSVTSSSSLLVLVLVVVVLVVIVVVVVLVVVVLVLVGRRVSSSPSSAPAAPPPRPPRPRRRRRRRPRIFVVALGAGAQHAERGRPVLGRKRSDLGLFRGVLVVVCHGLLSG